jgi:recombination protein RecA
MPKPTKRTPKSSPKRAPSKTPPSVRTASRAAKSSALDMIRANLSKDAAFSIVALSSDEVVSAPADWISTQSLALNTTLKTPGIPCGRVTEVYGKNHSGKTTLLAHLCAEAQRRGGAAFVLDQEATLDRTRFAQLGVDVAQLGVIQNPKPTIEDGVEAIEEVIDAIIAAKSKIDGPVVIGWDSIAAAPALKELEDSFKKQQPGAAAKVIRSMARRLVYKLAGTKIALVILNQTYSKVGVVYGNPEVPYGGDGLGYYATVRLYCRRAGNLSDGLPGSMAKIKVIKSKVSNATGAECEVAIDGDGFNNVHAIYSEFEARKLIAAGRSQAVRLADGTEVRWVGGWLGLARKCVSDPDLYARLVAAYQAIVSPVKPEEVVEEPEADAPEAAGVLDDEET